MTARHRPCINPQCDQPQRHRSAGIDRYQALFCSRLCAVLEVVCMMDERELATLTAAAAKRTEQLNAARPF